MAVPAGEVQAALGGLHVQVERSLTNFWATLDLSNPAAARDALLEFIPALTDAYGLEAAQIAADWYSELRLAQGVTGSYRATAGSLVEHEAIARRVRYGAHHLWTDVPADFIPFLRGAVTGWVTGAFAETIAENAERDGSASHWARKPNPGACNFCLTLASRSAAGAWQAGPFASRQSASATADGDPFHDDCRCIAVPIFKGMSNEQVANVYGFDPDDLYRRYQAGEFEVDFK